MRTGNVVSSPLLLVALLIVTTLVAFSQMPYGLDAAEPIGAYLDERFPQKRPMTPPRYPSCYQKRVRLQIW